MTLLLAEWITHHPILFAILATSAALVLFLAGFVVLGGSDRIEDRCRPIRDENSDTDAGAESDEEADDEPMSDCGRRHPSVSRTPPPTYSAHWRRRRSRYRTRVGHRTLDRPRR